jgi:hypothetical protein
MAILFPLPLLLPIPEHVMQSEWKVLEQGGLHEYALANGNESWRLTVPAFSRCGWDTCPTPCTAALTSACLQG